MDLLLLMKEKHGLFLKNYMKQIKPLDKRTLLKKNLRNSTFYL